MERVKTHTEDINDCKGIFTEHHLKILAMFSHLDRNWRKHTCFRMDNGIKLLQQKAAVLTYWCCRLFFNIMNALWTVCTVVTEHALITISIMDCFKGTWWYIRSSCVGHQRKVLRRYNYKHYHSPVPILFTYFQCC